MENGISLLTSILIICVVVLHWSLSKSSSKSLSKLFSKSLSELLSKSPSKFLSILPGKFYICSCAFLSSIFVQYSILADIDKVI